MAKKDSQTTGAGEILDTKNEKLEDAEFMEQLVAEEDANPIEPPRTDVLYGNAKKWITLSGGSFSGFASMQDIAQRWPKASGTFQRRFHFYKGGVKVHMARNENLNFDTWSAGIPVSNKKIKEMFPNIPFPWDDQEPTVEAKGTADPPPQQEGPNVIYINDEPSDPKFVNEDGNFYYQQLGPDKKPTMHFYHVYDGDDGRLEKVFFEQEAFGDLTQEEQRLFLQAHASPQMPQFPGQREHREPSINPSDVSKPETLMTILLNMQREDAKLAREELREERAAMRSAQTEMMKAIAEIKGGESSSKGMREYIEMANFMRDILESREPAPPAAESPLTSTLGMIGKVTEFLGTAAKARAAGNSEQMKFLQQVAADQAAAQNGNGQNSNGEKK